MPVYLDWVIESQDITKDEADNLASVFGYWLDFPGDYNDGFYTVSFYTDSIRAEDDIEESLKEFSKEHPHLRITAYIKQDTEECPDKRVIENGEIKYYTGVVKYYQYDPNTGQTSNIADDEETGCG